jgi:hypothetical protein
MITLLILRSNRVSSRLDNCINKTQGHVSSLMALIAARLTRARLQQAKPQVRAIRLQGGVPRQRHNL